MRKFILKCTAAILLVLLVFCLVMEVRFHGTIITDAKMTEDEILKEMPSIAVSETDLEMEKYVLSLPEVQALLDEVRANQTDEIPAAELTEAETEILLEEYMPEGYDKAVLSVIQESIYLQMLRGDKETIIYVFFTNGDTMQKTIALYRNGLSGHTCTACYSNDTMGVRKLIPKHQWFGWLKEM